MVKVWLGLEKEHGLGYNNYFVKVKTSVIMATIIITYG